MIQIVITADLTTNCGYAKINNESLYSVIPDSRADYGIVLFVKKNGVFDYNLSDFTNSDPWYIPIVNHTPYEVYAFQVPVWKLADVPYAVHSVVYDISTGLFWHNTNALGTSTVPGTGTDWVQIPNSVGGYGLFNTYASSGATITLQQDCPDYSLSKVQCDDESICCKTWRVCDNSSNTEIKRITIFDYNGNYISTTTIDPVVSLCVNIILPDSGVYIVGIEWEADVLDSTDISQYNSFLVIYEYCQLQHCAQYLIDQVLCSNDPCSEVCNPCNQDAIIRQQNARTELNRLVALFGTLIAMINAERIKYLGYYSYNATRADFVSKIGILMLQVNEISIRCGICTSAGVKATDNPTFQQVISTSTNRSSGCTECN